MYVFKNLENNEYVMCTRLPNWQVPNIELGDEGFLQIEKAVAGQQYFNPTTQETRTYQYSNIYFLNFVKKTDINNDNIII
jgi:hypothetical protein